MKLSNLRKRIRLGCCFISQICITLKSCPALIHQLSRLTGPKCYNHVTLYALKAFTGYKTIPLLLSEAQKVQEPSAKLLVRSSKKFPGRKCAARIDYKEKKLKIS